MAMEGKKTLKRVRVHPKKAKGDREKERERRRKKDRKREESSTGTKGAAMKQTNTERAGRGCRGVRARVEGRR